MQIWKNLKNKVKGIQNSSWYRKWVYRPYKQKSYSPMKEMLNTRDYAFLHDKFLDTKYTLKAWWEWPGDRLRDLKHYHQRGIHGVSDSDCWGLYCHLLNVKIRGLQYIKKYKHGCPCLEGFGTDSPESQTNEQFDAMCKEWDRIMDEMIWTFETAKLISGNELMSPPIEASYYTEEEVAKWQKFCDEWNTDYPQWEKHHVITKEGFERYKKGWEYYKIYFFSLWD